MRFYDAPLRALSLVPPLVGVLETHLAFLSFQDMVLIFILVIVCNPRMSYGKIVEVISFGLVVSMTLLDLDIRLVEGERPCLTPSDLYLPYQLKHVMIKTIRQVPQERLYLFLFSLIISLQLDLFYILNSV